MERRSDGTWLLVGVGIGCLFVVISVACLGTGALYYCSRGANAPPMPQPVTPYPFPTSVPPSPPAPTFVPMPPPTAAPPPTTIEDTRTVSATITSVTGSPGVSVGQTCEFVVERRDREDGSGFWCNAQIVCGGHLVYGGPTAGYFPCTLFVSPTRGVVGSDPNTTGTDQDAAMSIDTPQSHLEIWDDAQGALGEFRVIAHIDTVQ